FFFQAEDGIRDRNVTGVQTCALPISGEIDSGREQNCAPDASSGAQFCGEREATQPAQSVQMGTPPSSLASCDRCRTKKHSMQVKIGRASCRERVEINRIAAK